MTETGINAAEFDLACGIICTCGWMLSEEKAKDGGYTLTCVNVKCAKYALPYRKPKLWCVQVEAPK